MVMRNCLCPGMAVAKEVGQVAHRRLLQVADDSLVPKLRFNVNLRSREVRDECTLKVLWAWIMLNWRRWATGSLVTSMARDGSGGYGGDECVLHIGLFYLSGRM
jgi:hypothetical protein